MINIKEIKDIVLSNRNWTGNITSIVVTGVKDDFIFCDVTYWLDSKTQSTVPLGINIKTKQIINCTVDDD